MVEEDSPVDSPFTRIAELAWYHTETRHDEMFISGFSGLSWVDKHAEEKHRANGESVEVVVKQHWRNKKHRKGACVDCGRATSAVKVIRCLRCASYRVWKIRKGLLPDGE